MDERSRLAQREGDEALAPRREPAWILWFEDADAHPEVFAGAGAEEAARNAFEEAGQHWTVRLFREVVEP